MGPFFFGEAFRMHKILRFWPFAFLLAGQLSAAESWSALSVSGCEFEDVYASKAASCELSFSNNDTREIEVSNFRFFAQQGTANPDRVKIAPKSTARVLVSVDTSRSAGRMSYIVLFDSSPKAAYRSAKVRGFVRSALSEPSPSVNFGVVDVRAGSGSIKRELHLGSKEVANFRIERIVETPSWVTASVLDDGGLQLSVKDTAPWGIQDDYLRVAISTPNQPEVSIRVKADVHGEVVPSENPVDLGIIQLGNKNEGLIRLNDLTGKPLKLGALKIKGFLGDAREFPCRPKQAACRMVRIRVSEKQPAGSLKGELMVGLPGYQRRLPVYTWGMLIPKGYKIPSLNEKMKETEAASAADLTTQLKLATKKRAPTELKPPPGNGPLLKWVVSDAGTVYGFEVFRSDSESGPYLLMNRDLIRAETENDEQQAFQWRDTTAKPGSTYFYSIGIVRINGKKEPLIERQKVTVH